MPLQLTENNIRDMMRHHAWLFIDDPIKGKPRDTLFQPRGRKQRQRAGSFTRAILYSLAHCQKHHEADISVFTLYQQMSFSSLQDTLDDDRLSGVARQAICAYLFSLPGASTRRRRFWWEAPARRSHARQILMAGPPVAQLIDIFRTLPQRNLTGIVR